MKLFEIVWRHVLTQRPCWGELPVEARRVLLSERRMNGYSVGSAFSSRCPTSVARS